MRWTEHRRLAAIGVFATLVSGALYAIGGHPLILYLFGCWTGLSLLMVVLRWRWKI